MEVKKRRLVIAGHLGESTADNTLGNKVLGRFVYFTKPKKKETCVNRGKGKEGWNLAPVNTHTHTQ